MSSTLFTKRCCCRTAPCCHADDAVPVVVGWRRLIHQCGNTPYLSPVAFCNDDMAGCCRFTPPVMPTLTVRFQKRRGGEIIELVDTAACACFSVGQRLTFFECLDGDRLIWVADIPVTLNVLGRAVIANRCYHFFVGILTTFSVSNGCEFDCFTWDQPPSCQGDLGFNCIRGSRCQGISDQQMRIEVREFIGSRNYSQAPGLICTRCACDPGTGSNLFDYFKMCERGDCFSSSDGGCPYGRCHGDTFLEAFPTTGTITGFDSNFREITAEFEFSPAPVIETIQ